jgi:predicted DNA-binding transcriptional regulator AlpA
MTPEREQLRDALRDLEDAAARARVALEAERKAERKAEAAPTVWPSTPAEDRLLTAEQVALALGLDVGTVARRRFPFRVKLGRRTVRYSEAGMWRYVRNGGTP